jgi:hypothetical protein
MEEIQYEIGIISNEHCIVTHADYHITGGTSLSIQSEAIQRGPLLGFTIRSLDDRGQSLGYGHCSWALRRPLKEVISIPHRTPAFLLPDTTSLTSCLSDHVDGAWCVGPAEVGHLDDNGWSIFLYPGDRVPDEWIPLTDTDLLLGADGAQYHLSNANGEHLYLFGPGNEQIQGQGGAIHIRRERSYLSAQGNVVEFVLGHLDLAGPPSALNLPVNCTRLLQIGYRSETAFALCENNRETTLYLGTSGRVLMHWDRLYPVSGERVLGLAGDLQAGLLALQEEENLHLISWNEEVFSNDLFLNALSSPNFQVAVAQDEEISFAFWTDNETTNLFYNGTRHTIPVENLAINWFGDAVPIHSQFIGTTSGLLAIHAEGVDRLLLEEVFPLVGHRSNLIGYRSLDGRHYIMRGPRLTEILSSSYGKDWNQHGWRGDPLIPIDLAIAPSGTIIVSANTVSHPSNQETAPVLTSISGDTLSLPSTAQSSPETAPLLEVDSQGTLYAVWENHLSARSQYDEQWNEAVDLPGLSLEMVPLNDGVALLLNVDGNTLLYRCVADNCSPFPAAENRGVPTNIFSFQSGLCVTYDYLTLLCDVEGNSLSLSLEANPEWSDGFIIDGITDQNGQWIIALQTNDDGLLLRHSHGGNTQKILDHIRWAEGDVLINSDTPGQVIILETSGPILIEIEQGHTTIPGRLY